MRTTNVLCGIAVFALTFSLGFVEVAAQDITPEMRETLPETNSSQISTTGFSSAVETASPQEEGQGEGGGEDTESRKEESQEQGFGGKLPDGMSESLADFFLSILRGTASNVTKSVLGNTSSASSLPTQATGSSSTSSSSSPSSSSASASSESSPSASNTQAITNEKEFDDTDDEEYEYDEYDYYGDGDWSQFTTTGGYDFNSLPTTDEPFSRNGVPNCAVQVDLNHYCIIDSAVDTYFRGDLKVSGLRSHIFDMGIVNRLKQCPRGEWCLGSELEKLKSMEKDFYRGPYCDETMWECIFDVLVQREHCQDKEFAFLMDVADLLCEMFDTEREAEAGKDCFAHALGALHVTYADFLANNMSSGVPTQGHESICSGQTFRMTKSYLCADNSCSRYFDAKLAMEKFNRWSWFMDKVDEIVEDCDDMDDVCGTLGGSQDVPSVPKTWFGMTTPSFWTDYVDDEYDDDEYDDDYTTADRGVQASGNVGISGRFGVDQDESLMVALSVASAVGLLFLVLGLLFWRRSRRRSLYHYRSDYGKLPPDAAHLLPHDYDRDLD